MERTEIERFAIRVAANFSGVPEDTIAGVVYGNQPVNSPIDYIALVEAIIEAVMMLVDQCDESNFMANTKTPGITMRVWFRALVLRPLMSRELRRQVNVRELANSIIAESMTAGDAERQQVWDEVTDFATI